MAGGPYQYPNVPRSNGKAVASLVLGIVGIFVCPIIASVLAIIFGYSARTEIAASRGTQSGDSNAVAGIILGCVGLVLYAVGIIIWIMVAATIHSHSLAILMFI
jgi:hypothetical protein